MNYKLVKRKKSFISAYEFLKKLQKNWCGY